MSLLADQFRDIVSKDKDLRMSAEATCEIGYPTGFLNFDFMNGAIVHSENAKLGINEDYYSIGIADGSMNTIIGRSGCGKTTFCVQTACNIIRPFKTSCVFEDSIETGLTWPRRALLARFPEEELKERYIARNTGVTAENFYKRIKMIHDIKLANKEQYLYDTKRLDTFGNPIMLFEPTVYILDSIAMLMPGNMTDNNELSAGMSITSGAKTVTQLMRAIIPMLKSANIILLVVNHILQDVVIDPRQRKKADVAYLKPGETLPKGKTVIYLSNSIIRLDDATKLKGDEKFKINGSLVDISLVKSRNSRANQTTTLVFNQESGYDPELSLLVFLNQSNRVHGAGIGLFFDDRNDMKFSMGNFKKKLQNPDFYSLFKSIAIDELKKLPGRPNFDDIKSQCKTTVDLLNDVNSEPIKL